MLLPVPENKILTDPSEYMSLPYPITAVLLPNKQPPVTAITALPAPATPVPAIPRVAATPPPDVIPLLPVKFVRSRTILPLLGPKLCNPPPLPAAQFWKLEFEMSIIPWVFDAMPPPGPGLQVLLMKRLLDMLILACPSTSTAPPELTAWQLSKTELCIMDFDVRAAVKHPPTRLLKIIINPCKPYLSASATAPHPLGRRKAD
jgi:hypothetical protein